MKNRWMCIPVLTLLLALGACGGEDGTNNPDGNDTIDIEGDISWFDLDSWIPDTSTEDNTDPEDTWPDFTPEDNEDPDLWDIVQDTDSVDPQDADQTNPPDEIAPPDEVVDDSTKVSELQQSEDSLDCKFAFGSMLIALDVTLKNVVVSAPNYPYVVVGEPMDGFYVADPAGGAYSGIHVSFPAATAPDVVPGMVVTLVGDHKESSCLTNFQAKSIVIENPYGEPLQPMVVSPADIMADPEALEGMLLKIETVTVTDPNPDAGDFDDKQHFVVNEVLRVGNHYKVPYMTPPTDERTLGDEFHYITGVFTWTKENWVLMPRSGMDMWRIGDEPPIDVDPEIVEGPTEYVEEVPDTVEPVEYVEFVEPEPDVIDVLEDIVPDIQPDEITQDVPSEDTMPDVVIPEEPDSPIVITEIMYDPESPVYDDKGEWVEIYNASNDPVNLNGWRLGSDDGNMHIILYGADFWIQPGQYMVFGNQSIESQNGGLEIDYMYPSVDFTLENGMDSVILMNVFGLPVDSVHYNENMGWPEGLGASIQLYHPNLDNENPAHWKLATTPFGDETQLGTPGAPN